MRFSETLNTLKLILFHKVDYKSNVISYKIFSLSSKVGMLHLCMNMSRTNTLSGFIFFHTVIIRWWSKDIFLPFLVTYKKNQYFWEKENPFFLIGRDNNLFVEELKTNTSRSDTNTTPSKFRFCIKTKKQNRLNTKTINMISPTLLSVFSTGNFLLRWKHWKLNKEWQKNNINKIWV